jgi:hypothetical protein
LFNCTWSIEKSSLPDIKCYYNNNNIEHICFYGYTENNFFLKLIQTEWKEKSICVC